MNTAIALNTVIVMSILMVSGDIMSDKRNQEGKQLFYLLQFAGGTFPSGSFSQSWGLETYVHQGRITTEAEFSDFLHMYLLEVIGKSEGPALCHAWNLALNWDEKGLRELDELLTAMKLTKESREAGLRTGKAFMRIASAILEDEKVSEYFRSYNAEGINYPVGFGLVCGRLGLDKREVVSSYIFSTANAIVQSAVKLVPLGNTQAQHILLAAQQIMEDAASLALSGSPEEMTNFCPGLDIASIQHESLPVRLYMS